MAVLMGGVDVEGWVDDLGGGDIVYGVRERVVEACPVFGGAKKVLAVYGGGHTGEDGLDVTLGCVLPFFGRGQNSDGCSGWSRKIP